jgi:hypothetical protein
MSDLLTNPGPSTLFWSSGRSRTTASWNATGPHSWSEFVVSLNPEHPDSTKEIRPYVGGTLVNGRRTARTVDKRFILTLDADYADEDFLLDVVDTITSPYLIHTTWRHTDTDPRYRLIIPLDRAVTPMEYEDLAWRVMEKLSLSRFDRTTAQPERFMWGPSTQSPQTYLWTQHNAGQPYLAVNQWLDGPSSRASVRTAAAGSQATPTASASLRGAHSASPTEEEIARAGEILDAAVDDILHLRERSTFSGRNEAVFHLLPLLLQFAAAGALDEDEVLDRLFRAAQEVPADEPYTRQEFEASVKSARRYVEQEGPVLPETTATKLALSDFEGVVTDVDLWTATPQLRHIALAADSLGRNRLALLAAVLVRILARVDAGICLAGAEDGSVGSRAALNLGVALVGSSGQGKSTLQEMSGVLVPTPGIEQKPSTGQGLIQEYLEWNETDQKHYVISDPRRLFFFDEVDTLSATSSDKTSTLMSELRTMLTGGATGTANATAQRRRFLPARSYNFQMMLNVQPSRAGGLLRDRDAGTPQRFIWATVTDPNRAVHPKDRPAWPGPLDWNDAFLLGFELGEPVVDIPQWLKDDLLDYDYKVSKEGMEGGEVSWAAHQNLLRLKVAVGIAFLHESPRVETEHVVLADAIVQASLRVQRECEALIAKSEFNEQVARARTAERVVEITGDEKLRRLLKSAMGKLQKADGEFVYWNDLRPAFRDRAEWGEHLWSALSDHENVEVVVEGKSRKARWVQ